MSYAIIGCKTLERELNLAIQETGCQYPVIWVDSEYHINPNQLRVKLQNEIDNLKNIENILFGYGCCGNGLVGLKATSANLIIPRVDDCIAMVSSQPGEKFQRQAYTYFLTKGWIESPKSILNESLHAIERYGEKRARRIIELMLKNYYYLMLIDTGAYNIQECLSKVEEFADYCNLELVMSQGGIWFLEKLLTGPYDEDFSFIKKGATVSIDHFGYSR